MSIVFIKLLDFTLATEKPPDLIAYKFQWLFSWRFPSSWCPPVPRCKFVTRTLPFFSAKLICNPLPPYKQEKRRNVPAPFLSRWTKWPPVTWNIFTSLFSTLLRPSSSSSSWTSSFSSTSLTAAHFLGNIFVCAPERRHYCSVMNAIVPVDGGAMVHYQRQPREQGWLFRGISKELPLDPGTSRWNGSVAKRVHLLRARLRFRGATNGKTLA